LSFFSRGVLKRRKTTILDKKMSGNEGAVLMISAPFCSFLFQKKS
jgi:hypothetical protein